MRFGNVLLAIVCAAVCAARAGSIHRNDIPPRLQWEANGGYCGEVSLISAGLYYGQYMSQYDARICAIGQPITGKPETHQIHGELLLGKNDGLAARRMHLQAVTWKQRRQRSTGEFLRWVRSHVLRGHPVAIGVYNNEFILYGNKDRKAGDPQYDHIVPVNGISTAGGRTRLTFSDNGLFGHYPTWPFLFTYSFHSFPGDRRQANRRHGPVYTLPDYGKNFGIAVLGVMDRDGDTLPVRIATDKNYEFPRMAHDSNKRPEPMPLTLTVTVSNLVPGVAYRLYRYDHLSAIPDSHFNYHAADAAQTWDIRISAGSTFTITQDIMSDEIAAYRCVRADAR